MGSAIIVTWTGTPEDVRQIVEANDRMSFLLALSTELARIHSPQELVCTAMSRLRERLGAARVTLAEFDEDNNRGHRAPRNPAVRNRTSRSPV